MLRISTYISKILEGILTGSTLADLLSGKSVTRFMFVNQSSVSTFFLAKQIGIYFKKKKAVLFHYLPWFIQF